MRERNIKGPGQEGKKESHTAWAKKRALKCLEQGQLLDAIDSMVSDLSKDTSRHPDQMHMIGMMGMILRNKEDLTEGEVREFIVGFTE